METKNIENQRLLEKYNLYSRDIKRLLVACGIWPGLNPMLQRVVSYFSLAALSFSVMGSMNFNFHHLKDIMVFTQNIGLSVAMLGIMMKV